MTNKSILWALVLRAAAIRPSINNPFSRIKHSFYVNLLDTNAERSGTAPSSQAFFLENFQFHRHK